MEYISRYVDKELERYLEAIGAIIAGGEFAYTRKDGVKIIPIGCLTYLCKNSPASLSRRGSR